jgi:16S rRNA (guanine527-N7)-methyltransferase
MSGEMPPADQAAEFGPDDFARAAHVSRETLARLKLYAALLEEWNARHNLVSRNSLHDLWRRHFLDSAQLVTWIPARARSLVDLGSGAGFPGLVLAEMLREREGFRVVAIEATSKKAKFLSHVAERLDLTVEVRNTRIEDLPPEPFDVITARACAPLPELLSYAQRFWRPRTVGLFLKGQNVEAELTHAHKCWSMKADRHASQSDPSGTILELRELRGVRSER